jgi:DNA-directed RNA polymerase subunit K/omega
VKRKDAIGIVRRALQLNLKEKELWDDQERDVC